MTELSARYLAVEPDGGHRLVEPSYAGIKDGLHHADFDVVTVHGHDGGVDLYIDDEGMLNGALLNVTASMFAGIALYGPIVLTGPVDDEGETMLPPSAVVAALIGFADRWAAVNFDAVARKGQSLDVRADANRIPPPIVIGLHGDEADRYVAGDPEVRQRIQDRIDLGGEE